MFEDEDVEFCCSEDELMGQSDSRLVGLKKKPATES